MSEKLVSIIIRTKNEERWISSCLESVFAQDYKNFEVIVVDNNSTDKTVAKAQKFPVKTLNIEEFLPGRAINFGIENSEGDYLVCLSGHCIPVKTNWLSTLVATLEESDKTAGVYGRQEPLPYSSDLDKRDLIITFGLDRRVQIKDSFFHNANSIFRRDIWTKTPFCNEITNIEDRLWAKQVQEEGFQIIYEPEASVYHYHGIHQEADPVRARKIVKILEKIEHNNRNHAMSAPESLNTIAMIPIKGEVPQLGSKSLLEYTVQRAKNSKYIKSICVAADTDAALDEARSLGVEHLVKRTPELSREYVDVFDVIQFADYQLESQNVIADVFCYLSLHSPFRRPDLIDAVLMQLIEKNFDSIVPSYPEKRSMWKKTDDGVERIGEGMMPSKFKSAVEIGISGLCTCIQADVIRRGKRLGSRIGLFEVDDYAATIELNRLNGKQFAELLIEKWWQGGAQ